MQITIFLVVFFTSVVVFFSQELTTIIKRMMAIPIAAVCIPMVLFSWLIELYEDLVWRGLLVCKQAMHQLVHYLNQYLPDKLIEYSAAHIIQLCLLAGLPVWLLLLLAKTQKRYEPWSYSYQIGIAVWIFGAIILTIYQPQ
ncbi:MAG: hypothetical protein ACOVQX_00190 [Legionella sp.]